MAYLVRKSKQNLIIDEGSTSFLYGRHNKGELPELPKGWRYHINPAEYVKVEDWFGGKYYVNGSGLLKLETDKYIFWKEIRQMIDIEKNKK